MPACWQPVGESVFPEITPMQRDVIVELYEVRPQGAAGK
jgi:hypothetical protein